MGEQGLRRLGNRCMNEAWLDPASAATACIVRRRSSRPAPGCSTPPSTSAPAAARDRLARRWPLLDKGDKTTGTPGHSRSVRRGPADVHHPPPRPSKPATGTIRRARNPRTSQRAELDAAPRLRRRLPGTPAVPGPAHVWLPHRLGPDGEAIECGALRELDAESAEVKPCTRPRIARFGVAAAPRRIGGRCRERGRTPWLDRRCAARRDPLLRARGLHRIPVRAYADWDISVGYAESLV